MKKYTIADMYTDEEFSKIVEQSSSIREVVDRLGYSTHSGTNSETVKRRINRLGLDTSHFFFVKGVKRTPENTFVTDSTASQCVLRRMYKKETEGRYRCSICGQEPFWNGKSLTLILDHINGVNNDDRLENLRWVCPNCNQQLDTTNGKNIKRKRQIETEHFCVDCGKKITHRAIRCKSCNTINLTHIHNVKFVPRIDRDTLKSLIRVMPFTEIGKMYDVCDNTIREWCDFYNLPRRVHDIKKFTDQEWLKM